jgi:hypothetical protein
MSKKKRGSRMAGWSAARRMQLDPADRHAGFDVARFGRGGVDG